MKQKKTIAQIIATVAPARRCCLQNDREWADKHEDLLEEIEQNHLPSGSGFDCGTTIDRDKTTSRRIVIHTEFHHMNEVGYYDGWTQHTLYIHAGFNGPEISSISGRDRNEIKDYVAEVVLSALDEVVLWTNDGLEPTP